MENTNKQCIIKELRKHELCNMFWSEQIEKKLDEEITLNYEPIGEFGIYSIYYEFTLPYLGNRSNFSGTKAIIKIGITANSADYDIEKAIEGIDCFHNVQIDILKENDVILINRFRLWSGKEDEYSGNKEVLKDVLNMIKNK